MPFRELSDLPASRRVPDIIAVNAWCHDAFGEPLIDGEARVLELLALVQDSGLEWVDAAAVVAASKCRERLNVEIVDGSLTVLAFFGYLETSDGQWVSGGGRFRLPIAAIDEKRAAIDTIELIDSETLSFAAAA